MKPPREIEELMWEVAERGDAATIDQFYSRYPEFSDELDKRVQMVKSLRGSRPRKDAPSFVLREHVPHLGPSRWAVAGVALLVLASVTYATYAAMQFVNSRKATAVVIEPPPEIIFNPPKFLPQGERTNGAEIIEDGEPPLVAQDEQRPEIPDIFMGLVTLKEDDISLVAAIHEIAQQAGLEATIAPGFEDKRIRISMENQPALPILQQLGQRFGFTAFKQGTIQLLIVPARPNGEIDASGAPAKASVSVSEAASRTTDPPKTDDDKTEIPPALGSPDGSL